MASIMGRKDKLVPEAAEEEGTGAVPADMQEIQKQGKESGVSRELNQVGGVPALVQTFSLDSLVQCAVLADDLVLHFRLQRRISVQVQRNLLLCLDVEERHLGLLFLFFELDRRDRSRGGGASEGAVISAASDGIVVGGLEYGRGIGAFLARLILVRLWICGLGLQCIEFLLGAEIATLDGRHEVGPTTLDAADLEGLHALLGLGRVQTGSGEELASLWRVQWKRIRGIHGDLVGGISADHVLDGLVAAGVVLDPGIALEDPAVDDYDVSAFGDQRLDLWAGVDAVPAACGLARCGGRHCGRGREVGVDAKSTGGRLDSGHGGAEKRCGESVGLAIVRTAGLTCAPARGDRPGRAWRVYRSGDSGSLHHCATQAGTQPDSGLRLRVASSSQARQPAFPARRARRFPAAPAATWHIVEISISRVILAAGRQTSHALNQRSA